MKRLYDFDLRVAAADSDGYYVTRWDEATKLTVRATDRSEAFTECWRVMGKSPRGRYWTAILDRATPTDEMIEEES